MAAKIVSEHNHQGRLIGVLPQQKQQPSPAQMTPPPECEKTWDFYHPYANHVNMYHSKRNCEGCDTEFEGYQRYKRHLPCKEKQKKEEKLAKFE
jgi:hypothetical protein